MLDKFIYSKRLFIKDIEKCDVSFINSIYNDLDFYFYAIGPHTSLREKYFKQFVKQDKGNSFFYIIKHIENNNSIGCIEGNIYCGRKRILWITSIMVNKEFCRKGYGSEIVLTLVDYFKLSHNIESVCASVAQKNSIGKKFWSKLGFSAIKTIRRYDTQKLMFGNIIIYCKSAQ